MLPPVYPLKSSLPEALIFVPDAFSVVGFGNLGAELAVGTKGGEPTIANDGEKYYEQGICQVKATDTMGAGDSFISAFLVNYYSAEADELIPAENKITVALQKAAEFAATVVVKDGSLGVGYDVDPDRLSEIINL